MKYIFLVLSIVLVIAGLLFCTFALNSFSWFLGAILIAGAGISYDVFINEE